MSDRYPGGANYPYRGAIVLGPAERLLLVVVVVVVVALGSLWLATALAAALFGSGWAGLGARELLGAALALPQTLADPAQAWPRGARRGLAGGLAGRPVLRFDRPAFDPSN